MIIENSLNFRHAVDNLTPILFPFLNTTPVPWNILHLSSFYTLLWPSHQHLAFIHYWLPNLPLLLSSRAYNLLSHYLHQEFTQFQPIQNWTHPLSSESTVPECFFSQMAPPSFLRLSSTTNLFIILTPFFYSILTSNYSFISPYPKSISVHPNISFPLHYSLGQALIFS